MANEYPKKRVVVQNEVKPHIEPELPPVSDAVVLSQSSDARLDANLPQLPQDESVITAKPIEPSLYSGNSISALIPGVSGALPDNSDTNVLSASQKVNLQPDLPEVNDSETSQSIQRSPGIKPDLPEIADPFNTQKVSQPELRSDLPEVSDDSKQQEIKQSPGIKPDLPNPSDTDNPQRAQSLELRPDLPDTADDIRIQKPFVSPDAKPNLPDVQDTPSIQTPNISGKLEPNLPQIEDDVATQVSKQSPGMRADLPEVVDKLIPQPHVGISSTIRPELPEVQDDLRQQRGKQSPDIKPDLPETGDDRDLRFQTNFDGEWLPDWSGINVGPKNYQTLRNLRYKADGLEGIDGTSRINTNATGKYLKNGIQLTTPYTQASYIIVQGEDSDGTDRILIKNTQTVPTAADFDGVVTVTLYIHYYLKLWAIYDGTYTSPIITLMIDAGTYSGSTLASHIQERINASNVLTFSGNMSYAVSYAGTSFTITATGGTVAYVNLGSTIGSTIGFTENQGPSAAITSDTAATYSTSFYSEDSSASRGRFSKLPAGHIGFCDQKANKIWAGDEMPVGAFLYGTEATHIISAAANDEVEFISNHGTKTIDIAADTYTGITLAAKIQEIIRSDGTLLLPDATVEYRLGKFWIDAASGHTIKCTGGGDGAPFLGFDVDSGTGTRILWSPSAWTPSEGGGWGHVAYFDALKDFTKEINNVLTTTGNTISIASATTYNYFLVGSTRPLKGMKITNTSGAFTTSTLSGTYFNGEKMAALSSLAVSTSSSVSTITWTDTNGFAKPILINGYYFYFYRFELKAGETAVTISNIVLNADIQTPSDLWDGIYRTCQKFLYVVEASGEYTENDYTLEVADIEKREFSVSSTVASDMGKVKIGTLNAAAASDFIEAWFEEPMCAFKWDFSTPEDTGDAYSLAISFWDGTQYVGARTVYDTLKDIGDNFYFGKSGGINFFDIPLYDNTYTAYTGLEHISEKNGIKGYRYKIQWTFRSTTEFTELVLDQFKGVPRYRTLDKNYAFPAMYRNRALWLDCVSDNQRNRCDYSSKYRPDVYNGTDASGRFNERSLKFGSNEPLTAFTELFNQFSDGLDSVGIALKATKTYVLTGDSPSEFKVRTLSHSIGCPAPLTLDTAEITTPNGRQNVAIWMDANAGPVMCNGGTIQPFVGEKIKRYWTPGSDYAIPAAYVGNCAGIYDPNFNEYHLVIPSGSTATYCNTWLVYDLTHNKWRENYISGNLTTDDFPQGFMRVEDTYGNKYIYALTNTGYMIRLDYGRTWSDGAAITYTVKTGDVLFTNSVWDESQVRRIKLLHDVNAAGYVTVNHYLNGYTTRTSTVGNATSGLPPSATPRTMAYSGYNYRNMILQCAKTDGGSPAIYSDLRGLTHAFEFIVTNCSAVKPKLLGYAAQFISVREDVMDKDGV